MGTNSVSSTIVKIWGVGSRGLGCSTQDRVPLHTHPHHTFHLLVPGCQNRDSGNGLTSPSQPQLAHSVRLGTPTSLHDLCLHPAGVQNSSQYPGSLPIANFFFILKKLYFYAVQHERSSFPTADQTHAPALGTWSLNHWTTKEIPRWPI